jgi:VanZ family protein
MIVPSLRTGFLLAVAAVIWTSLMPAGALPRVELDDKLQHLASYALVAFLGGAGFAGWRAMLAVALGLCVLGLGLELAQGLVPGRHADPLDGLANALGAWLGAGAGALAIRLIPPAAVSVPASRHPPAG